MKRNRFKQEVKLLDNLFDELFPIMRSITGPGIEDSIGIFSKYLPLEVTKIPTGSNVFDWEVPPEWHFKRATLVDPDGKVVCDAEECNLHVLNYSCPVNVRIDLELLQHHLHSMPDLPEAIPYVTSYYKERWGFCLAHERRVRLTPGIYHARIETEFVDGGVPFAQCKLSGESEREILLSSYLCHPSLANNELSGPLVLLGLYNRIKSWPRRRYTYRFLLNPETIGALCFLQRHAVELQENLVSGLVLTCLGGPSGSLLYKASRRKDALIDKVVDYVEAKTVTDLPVNQVAFTPLNGSDERQYCSPGFNFPVGQLSRTTYGKYEGYHNSLDTKEFMQIENLVESIDAIEKILRTMEVCGCPVNLSPFGEPQLGRRGLYPRMNSHETRNLSEDKLLDGRMQLNRLLTLLNMADGKNSVIDIAETCGCHVDELRPVIEKLELEKLIAYNTKPRKI